MVRLRLTILVSLSVGFMIGLRLGFDCLFLVQDIMKRSRDVVRIG